MPPILRRQLAELEKSKLFYNPKQLQSYCSSVCGHYCILFLLTLQCGIHTSDFVDLFDPVDTKANDRIVRDIVEGLFDVQFTEVDHAWREEREEICRTFF